MADHRKRWSARLTGWGNRLTADGNRAVYLQARITDPTAHDGRVIYIEITPELARQLADRLERNAQEADEYNARPLRVG